MASSDSDAAEISSLFERLFRTRDVSMFLPFLFGLSESRNSDDPDQETESEEGFQRQRIILVNPFTQGMVVIDGASSLEALFRELGSAANKGGRPPASKESIDAMPSVEVGEGDDDDGECVVCLEGFEVGKVVKEMPCKHRFHPDCIEKWLGIHGSCPVCRYEMPVEEKDVGKKGDEEGEEGGEERRRVGGEVWVSFSFNGSSRNQEPNQAPSHDDSSDSSSSPRGDTEVEES
uniref:RING-type E3 ubiquitin transferase n=2 Tax=Lotus japonicus TaxID=34305 RepID=I3SF02_LOTJA|nr:unknown [Lotus japonicus]